MYPLCYVLIVLFTHYTVYLKKSKKCDAGNIKLKGFIPTKHKMHSLNALQVATDSIASLD